jgi:hypothetical protein
VTAREGTAAEAAALIDSQRCWSSTRPLQAGTCGSQAIDAQGRQLTQGRADEPSSIMSLPHTNARDQAAAVFTEEQHEHPGPVVRSDLPQANRLLTPTEQSYRALEAGGLDTVPAGVPESAPIDMGERLSGRSPGPDNMRTAAAERSQGGGGRLILADQQSFERFPLHAVTPARILLHSKLSSTTRCERLKDQRYPLAPFDGVAAVHPALGQCGPIFQYTAKCLCRQYAERDRQLRQRDLWPILGLDHVTATRDLCGDQGSGRDSFRSVAAIHPRTGVHYPFESLLQHIGSLVG